MYREITDGFYWFQELGSHRDDFVDGFDGEPDWYIRGEKVYNCQNAYLLYGDRSLMWDTTSPANREIVLADLEEALDGADLDYLVVSHPDIPHSGNAHAILEAHPEATLVAPAYGSLHELYHLEDAEKMAPGESIDLGGFEVTFEEAPVVDAPMTSWMSESTMDALFTVDWMCFPIMGREALRAVDENPAPVTVDRMVEFNGRVIFWLQYVDPTVIKDRIERYIDDHPVSVVAPTHGLVIREDAVDHMRKYAEVVDEIAEHGRIEAV